MKDINDKIKEYEKRGEKLSELPALTNWIGNLEQIKQDICMIVMDLIKHFPLN